MNRGKFELLLLGSSYLSFKFAEKYLKDKLVPEFRYDIHLNYNEELKQIEGFDVYPEDKGKVMTDVDSRTVSDILFRKGKVPVWIDISVQYSNRKTTTFLLLCSGRYTNNEEDIYYTKAGTGPFGIKSPYLPPNYKEGKRFRLKKRKA